MYESSDPTTSETYAWTSKMVYSVDPLNAGFFFPAGVDDRGANVLAIFFARLLTSLSRSAARSVSDDSARTTTTTREEEDVASSPSLTRRRFIAGC